MTDEFAKWSKGYVLFCHITTHLATEKYDQLLSEKGGNGFPYLVFMDSEGNVIARHEGSRDAAGFAETGKKAQAFLDLQKKAAKGDRAAKIDLLIAQLELGHLKMDEAQGKLKELGELSKEQKAKVDGLLVGAEVQEILKTVKRGDKPSAIEAGKKFYEMNKAKRPAPMGDNEFQGYWILMMDYAESQKDAAVFEAGLEALKARYGSNIRAEFVRMNEERLKKIKDAGK